MSTYLPCHFCQSGHATHRGLIPSGARWICDECEPLQSNCRSAETLQRRMADALVLAKRLCGLDLTNYRRCCEHLHGCRFYGIDIVDHVEAALTVARLRVRAGELASYELKSAAPREVQPAFYGFG